MPAVQRGVLDLVPEPPLNGWSPPNSPGMRFVMRRAAGLQGLCSSQPQESPPMHCGIDWWPEWRRTRRYQLCKRVRERCDCLPRLPRTDCVPPYFRVGDPILAGIPPAATRVALWSHQTSDDSSTSCVLQRQLQPKCTTRQDPLLESAGPSGRCCMMVGAEPSASEVTRKPN